MKAIVIEEFGGPDVLSMRTLPDPEPGSGEVLVRVAAVCIGRLLDLGARAGKLPFAKITFPHILGAEHAGEIVGIGQDVKDVDVGDHVAVYPAMSCGSCPHCVAGDDHICPDLRMMGIHQDGAYCELTVVPAGNVCKVPAGVSSVQAAAMSMSGATAINQLNLAGVSEGMWVLVQAASSALGSVTAALAVNRGARVIGTTRHAWKRERLEGLGLEAVLDHQSPEFIEIVRNMSGGGVDVVVDNIGEPELWGKSVAALGRGGTVVTSGAFLGGQVSLDVRSLYTLSQRILGVRTGNRESFRQVWEAVEAGVEAPIDRTFALQSAADAHRHMEASDNVGRVLLEI